MGKYISRAGKYVLKMVVLLAIVFALMALTGMLNRSLNDVFNSLFNSLPGLILIGALIVFALLYPKMSFMKGGVRGDMTANREDIVNAFASANYVLASENGGRMVFRARTFGGKLLAQWDDAVVVTQEGRFIEMEGLKKVVSRVELRLNAYINKE